eukprot:c6175_g1_i2.p1 GENE.c6175_g1_i2~~c6175_g1_i2.p1  ORF type:complete len:165 (-),score=28.38 c6175_g1_i2:243-737(-)
MGDFKAEVEAALAHFRSSSPDIELTRVKAASTQNDNSVHLELIFCDHDSCRVEQVVVTRTAAGLSVLPASQSQPKPDLDEVHIVARLTLPDPKTQWQIYSINNCPWCVKAKQHLQSRGYPFQEYNCDEVVGGKSGAADSLAPYPLFALAAIRECCHFFFFLTLA